MSLFVAKGLYIQTYIYRRFYICIYIPIYTHMYKHIGMTVLYDCRLGILPMAVYQIEMQKT